MAETNFANLTDEEKTVWSRDVWKTARQQSYLMGVADRGGNSPVHRITELTQDERGSRAVLTLVPDLEGDGVAGDTEIEGNEEEAKAVDRTVHIDQLRNANKLAGRMANQKSVVKFRETSRDLLAYWLADRVDQIGFLVASGVDLRMRTNGALRPGFSHNGTSYSRNTTTSPVGQALVDLEFASDPDGSLGDRISAPSAARHFRWDKAAADLDASEDSSDVVATDTPTYGMLVELKAYAKDKRIKPIRGGEGRELFHVFMHPRALAKLKLDSDFLANLRNAGPRGKGNPLFSGAIETVDGLVIHENTHVFNTLGATTGTSGNAGTPGYKWGANANVDGTRTLLMGAQALAFADIGIPMWDERDHFDYGAKPGIAIAKIFGFHKPQFYSPMDNSNIATDKEDFGVIAVDHAI